VAADRRGDSSIVVPISAAARFIYDSAGGTIYSLVPRNPLGLRSGTSVELQGSFLSNRVARVVSSCWTSEGKYSVEFYFQRDSLVYAFEGFVYFPDAAPRGQWRNWMNLPAWESRSYWRADSVAFVEARGRPAQQTFSDAALLRRRAAELRRIIEERRRELSRERPEPSPSFDVAELFVR
jgi:hypothetical protein